MLNTHILADKIDAAVTPKSVRPHFQLLPCSPQNQSHVSAMALPSILVSPIPENFDQVGNHRPSISSFPITNRNPEFSITRETAFLVAISSAQLITQATLAQSVAPLHLIGASFKARDSSQLSWLPAAFSLTVGTFILPAGRWGDLFGHRKLVIIGYGWLALWSVVAGLAVFSHDLAFFAFCRAMQGIGSALLLPNAVAVLTRIYPKGPRKDMVVSIFGSMAPTGFVLGAVSSGIFTRFSWWPWAYWLNGMVSAALGLAVKVVVPQNPGAGLSQLAELDILGTILGVASVVCFNFSWNQGAAEGWGQVYVDVLLVFGIGCFGVFVWYELQYCKFPILPISSISRDISLILLCQAVIWASFGIWFYYLWQFWEIERGQSVLQSSAQATPTVISGCIAAFITGKIVGKTQPGVIMLISASAFFVGTILLGLAPVDQTYWKQTFFSVVITPWGMDMAFPAGVIMLSNHMPQEQQGGAASLINSIVNYSISIGLGMAGTVESQVNDGGRDTLKGLRGACYLGIGFDSLALSLSMYLILEVLWKRRSKPDISDIPTNKEG